MKSKTNLFTLVIHVPGLILNYLQVQPNKKMFVFQQDGATNLPDWHPLARNNVS